MHLAHIAAQDARERAGPAWVGRVQITVSAEHDARGGDEAPDIVLGHRGHHNALACAGLCLRPVRVRDDGLDDRNGVLVGHVGDLRDGLPLPLQVRRVTGQQDV